MFSFLKQKNKTINTPWLLVGLGNPGTKYQNHRHNVGFMAIEKIAEHHEFPPFRSKHKGLMAEGRIGNEKVILLQPQTMMNNSGQSVAATARFFKITPERVVVFHDELDLPFGTVRVKDGGGHAGHNGLRSMDAHLKTRDYRRIRIGIGHPGSKEKVTSHVLGDFSKEDQKHLPALLEKISDHASLLFEADSSSFSQMITNKS